MILDRLQYFLEHFWHDHKCDQIWTPGPRIYHQNASRYTRNLMGTSLKIIISHIWESEILRFSEGLSVHLTSWNFGMCKFDFVENLKTWKDGIWKIVILEIWYLEVENLQIGNLKIDIWKLENPQHPQHTDSHPCTRFK